MTKPCVCGCNTSVMIYTKRRLHDIKKGAIIREKGYMIQKKDPYNTQKEDSMIHKKELYYTQKRWYLVHKKATRSRNVVCSVLPRHCFCAAMWAYYLPWRSSDTVNFLRPFALREAKTRRPFFVAILSRKPCLFTLLLL